MLDKLPSFNPENRELYARWRTGVRDMEPLIGLAQSLDPQEAAALERCRDSMQSGLRRKIAADAMETIGICAAQVGACAFFPVIFTGSAALIGGAAGAIIGGALFLVGGILLGQRQPQSSLLKCAGNDLQVLVRYKNELAAQARQKVEADARVTARTEAGADVLRKAAAPADGAAPRVVRGPQFVDIGGIKIPVQRVEEPPEPRTPAAATA